MVSLIFQQVGVMRVAYMMTKGLWMVPWNSCRSILSTIWTWRFAKRFDAFTKGAFVEYF